MRRFPVLKALAEGQKVFKMGPVALDKRQGIIVMASIFGYWTLYKQASRLLDLSPAQAAVLLAPLMLTALVFAFVRHDGRHVDWWVQKKWSNAMRPKTLLFKRPKTRSAQGLRDSVQAALPAERIVWEMARTQDGVYLLVFEVEPVSLSLAGEAEKERVWAANAQLYNRIDFPVVEMTRSREGNVAVYTRTLREHVLFEVNAQEQPELALFARQELEFMEDIVPTYNVYDRTGYVILPYKPPQARREKEGFFASIREVLFGRRPTKKAAVALQKEAEAAYRELSHRAEIVYDAFVRMGARLRVLTDRELLNLLRDQLSGEDGPEAPMWDPVTLEVGGYGRLSEDQLRRVVAATDRVRQEAPPAVGLGNLTLADKVSPDAVRIHADYLRVGGRYHATLFVFNYPPDVAFGELQALLHIPGRVRVVKYVRPLPQNKAVERMGGTVAELEAARHTASDGNVIASRERDFAAWSADQAMNELLTGEQGYLEVSLLVHCEADSKDELHSLVESARTKLAGLRYDAKLAREEAWEGFVSSLGFKNLLSHRYCSKGLLTNPLACLFIYGSYQVNHPDGILLGVDPISGGLIVLDSRELMNPHMVILGTSGGGKTQTVKAISSRLRLRGHRVVIVDPVGDSKYGPVARALNGEYVVFSAGSPHKFNPCDLGGGAGGYLNLHLLAGAAEEEDPEEARRKARAAALDGKILSLTRLVSLMAASDDGQGGLRSAEQGLVDKLWYEVYAEKGITGDPDTHEYEPPTFRDFFRHLAGAEELAHLREQLYPWENGALRTFFDSQTDVDLENKYLVFQIAGVTGREKAAIMYALLDFLNGRLSDPDELSDLFIDEFWSMLKYPMAASFSEEMFRSGRARNNAMVAITQDVEEFTGSKSGQVILRIAATHLILKQRKKTVEVLQDFYDFSEEQRSQVLNFAAGEGYLVVEENQIPLYVICSDFEMRLFNTDAKKELRYRKAELETARLELDAGPSPQEAGGELAFTTLPAPTVRRLSGAGRARALLTDDDTYVPREEDYEDLPASTAPAPRQSREEPATEAATGKLPAVPRASRPPDDVLHLSVPNAEDATIHAVVGPTAGTVAYNLAGLFARAGKDQGRKVLLVDAEGHTTRKILAGVGEPPDELVVNGGDLGDYVAFDPHSNLGVLLHPISDGLPAARVIALASREADLVVVACAPTMYADDWLRAADAVVATDKDARSLAKTLERAEEVRGTNGTLLAPMGRPKLTPDLMTRRVFRLPSQSCAAFREAEQSGAFAALKDAEVGRAFRPLLEELLQATRKEVV